MADFWLTPDHLAALSVLQAEPSAHVNMWIALPLERAGYIQANASTEAQAARFTLTAAGHAFLDEVRRGDHHGLRLVRRARPATACRAIVADKTRRCANDPLPQGDQTGAI